MSASTLNPKYDKRWKKGEDAYFVDQKFICCLDGVSGWARRLHDSGNFTKELIINIEEVYRSGEYKSIQDILT